MVTNTADAAALVTEAVKPSQVFAPHFNYAWRSLDEVPYARFPGGRVVSIAAPNSTEAVDQMDTSFALRTRALESEVPKLTHCAHYYFNRACRLGDQCMFIHAVFVDPDAVPGTFAPTPAELGRTSRLPSAQTSRRNASTEVMRTRPSPSYLRTRR
jgi:hypothetical protein